MKNINNNFTDEVKRVSDEIDALKSKQIQDRGSAAIFSQNISQKFSELTPYSSHLLVIDISPLTDITLDNVSPFISFFPTQDFFGDFTFTHGQDIGSIGAFGNYTWADENGEIQIDGLVQCGIEFFAEARVA